MNKDNKKAVQQNIFDIPDSIIPTDKRLFYPDWSNKPPKQDNVIKTQNKRVLTTGNILAICSKPGIGKSGICEAQIAYLLNPKCDSLGFQVVLRSPRDKVLYIDTERTIQDTWNAWERTYKRAGKKAPEIDKRIIFSNFKAVNVADRKKHVETILKNNPDIGLIIFDGAGDFIRDTNSIPESSEFIDWINSFNPLISLVCTIHTNPTDEKPRGHIGSEICRRAESVFLVRKLEDGIREITTNFVHGKVRNDDDAISTFYKYSDTDGMFITTDYTPAKALTKEKAEKYSDMARDIFDGRTECSASFIIQKIAEKEGIKEVASKGIFYRHFKDKIVKSEGNAWRIA